MTLSAFDHPLLSRLVGDDDTAMLFSLEAEIDAARDFEAALAVATEAAGLTPEGSAEAIAAALEDFFPDLNQLADATERDGLMVPDLVKQMRAHVGEPNAQYVHFGATSQDVIDTSLILRLRPVLSNLEVLANEVIGQLYDLEEKYGTAALTGVTRMQNALPITGADRLQGWRAPLVRHMERLEEILPRLMVVQFGGAVGTLDKLGDKAPEVADRLAQELGLRVPDRNWHNQRDIIAELGGWLGLVTGSLGKMGQDLALMAQNDVGEVTFEGGGGSSAMPHKQNPVGAEVLVALARFNAVQTGALQQSMVHEMERSGAAWTLEWLVLPQMVVATAGALRRASSLLGSIKTLGKSA